MEAGADTGAYNKEGRTAIDIAIGHNHRVLECYLRGAGARSSVQFWNAADTGTQNKPAENQDDLS